MTRVDEIDKTSPKLHTLGWVFARYGNFTFGGGSATVATLQHEIVDRRRWVGVERFHLCFALSRLTPGTNLLACCTGVGWSIRRWTGAIISLLASSLPCSAMAVVVTTLYQLWSRRPVMLIAIHGALAAAVGVMVTTGVTLIRPHWRSSSWLQLAVFVAGSFAVNYFLSVPPLRILLGGAIIGWFWPRSAAE